MRAALRPSQTIRPHIFEVPKEMLLYFGGTHTLSIIFWSTPKMSMHERVG